MKKNNNIFMQTRGLLMLLFLLLNIFANAQNNINRVEYFFDTDPGFGLATSIPITANADISNQIHSIDISAISNGFHNFFIRSRDDSGSWSLSTSSMIFRGNFGATSNAPIVKAEYFFDADPGFGNAIPIRFSAANNISDVILAVDISTIQNGFHSFYIRSQDENGVWSLTNTQSIFKAGSNSTIQNIVATEYFFDTDPGFGNASAIPFTPSTNVADQILAIDIAALTNGFHSFFIRSKDANGNWSLTNTSSIFKTNGNTIANIVKAEYFIDTDPGFGNATNLPVTPALNIADQINNVTKPSTLSDGTHYLSLRTQDANGTWSLTNTIAFDHVVPKAGSGYCLQFNASSKKITATQQTTVKNSFTMEAWVNASATTTIQTQTNSGTNGLGGTNQYVVFPTYGASNFVANSAGAGFTVGTNGVCVFEHDASYLPVLLAWSGTLTGWNHIAVVYTNKQPQLYINGKLVATGLTSTKTNVFASNAEIGSGAYGSFSGYLDEFKIWDISLTQTQIRERMCKKIAETDVLFSNLIINYNFDESVGNTAYNKFSINNNATLVNAPARVLSGAAIGDTSVYSYVTSGLPSATISANAQDSLSIALNSGTYAAESGLQLYVVNSKPNSQIGLGGIALSNDRYFGVFPCNITTPSYTATYNYATNPFIVGVNDNELGLFKRNNNADTTWANSNANLNIANKNLQVTGQNTEYILSNCATLVTPSIATTRNLVNVCNVLNASFATTITYGGAAPIYQWKLNGNDIGTNASSYANNSLNPNDTVYCVLTSNVSCYSTLTAISNKIIATVIAPTTQNINVFGCFTTTYNSVNYTTSTNFIDTLKTTQGCDSVYKNVSITVYTNAVTYDTIRVEGCNSVLYNTVTYTSSTAYTDTVKTGLGCDNIYRRIIITVYNVSTTTTTETLIGCGSYTFNSINYTSNITVRDTVTSIHNCDSIYNIHNIVIITPTTQNSSLLGCGSVTYKSTVYNSSTVVLDTLKSATGCDSVYKNVTIIVVNPLTLNYSLSGCNSVGYNNNIYTNSTIVHDTLHSSLGCDSVYNVVTINVTAVTALNQVVNMSGCNSVVYQSITYNNSTTLNHTIPSYQGCDSVYKTVHITVHHLTPTTHITNESGCNSVVYNSNTYTSSIILRDTVRSVVSNCDSIYNVVNINVTTVNAASQTIDVAGCDSAIYNSITYFASTILHDTLVSYQGCDSVYKIINITVVAKPTINVTASVNPVCSTNPTILTATGGSNYTWSPSTALSNTTGTSVTASPFSAVTYTVTSNNVCVVSKQIVVNVNPLPNVNAGANQSILLGSSTTLTATGAASYTWNTIDAADTTASIVVAPTSNTNYTVTGVGANGCTAQDLVTVSVNFSSLAVNTNNFNFGNVVVNTTSSTNIIVTNNGTLPITLNGVTTASPYTSSIAAQSIAANASFSIPVSFNPTATLFYVNSLTINTSIGNFVVTLQGRGVAPAPSWVITPSTRSFANTLVNDSSTQTFIVFNTGNIPIAVSSIGSSNAVFAGVSLSNTIAVGGNATVTVKYKPTTIGVNNATININSSTPSLAAITATVTGSCYVNNVPPTLHFVSATPYNASNGVNPILGQAGTYTYRILYKSSTNTAPQLGYPKVGIDKNGDGDYIDNDEGVFAMNQLNTTNNWVVGEEFTFSTNLAIGNLYGYKFFANDSLGNPAIATSTAHNYGPNVTDQTLDLSIYANDISFSVGHPNVGQTFTVFATVHNNTPYSASNINIRFYTDSVYYNETTLPYIGANSTATISMNFVYNLDGFYPIKVWVDSANNLGETNALNNYAIRPIIVGNFTVPGAIVINANASPQNCPSGVVFSGTAHYTGLNLVGNPAVLGALVTVKENGVTIATTYTITEGYWSVYITQSCGTHTYTVEVTDFTLTGIVATQSYTINCGVNCEPPTGGTGNDVEPKYTSSTGSLPCCIIANNPFTNSYSFTNKNTYKYVNDTVLVYADDTLKHTYLVDTLLPNQTLNYNNSFNFNSGNHTIKYYTIAHYSFKTISIDTGFRIAIITHTGRIFDSSINHIYIDTPKADLALSEFAQTNAHSLSIKVGNATCINAGASKLYVYETNSNYDSASKVLLDSVSTTAILAGKCVDTRAIVNYTKANWTQGYHYIILQADGGNAVDEKTETNNELRTTIYVPQPDVLVQSIETSNSNVHTGDAINFVATIKNNGSDATNFKVQFKVNNVALGSQQTIAFLGAGATTVVSSIIYNIPANNCPITITAIADVDNDLIELNENNNRDSIYFGSDISSGQPCYNLGSSCSPYTVFIGGTLNMASIVRNTGLRDVDTTKVQFVLNGNIIGTDNITHITANSIASTTVSHTFNTVGSYVIEVQPDYNNAYCELDEMNNNGYIYVNVVSALPDLQILSQHISPSNLNPNPGQNITVAVSVVNIGNAASIPSYVRFWVDNVQLGLDLPLNAIKVGRDTTVLATATYAGNSVGPKIIRARVDYNEVVGVEQTFTNNEATRSIICGAAPDFARTIHHGITFSKNSFRKGETINVCNYIRNYGGNSGSAYIKFYYATPLGKTLIDSVPFTLNDHDSIKVCTNWQVSTDSGTIITEITGSVPAEFNVLNNIDSIGFIVNNAAMPIVSIVSNITTACAGVPINFSSTVVGAINPTFKWKVNNIYIGDTTVGISLSNLHNKDSVVVEVYENGNLVASSNSITITIKNATTSITNIAICANQLPYSWGGNNYNTFGIFTRTFVNSVGCDSIATLNLTASINVVPTVNITASTSTFICNGSTVMFTVNTTNAGTLPTYQWKKNGLNVGTNSNVYTTNTLANSDSVWCVVTNTQTCALVNAASSNKIGFVVNIGTAVGATLNYKLGGVVTSAVMCKLGDTLQLVNYSANTGIWSINNSSIATIIGNGKVAYVIANNTGTATVAYSLISATGCSSSSSIAITVAPVATPATISGSSSVCAGSSIALATAASGGVWSNASGYATVNTSGVVTGSSAGIADIRYTVSNAAGCKAYSNKTITVNALPAIPSIAYGVPFNNPQAGAPSGGWCAGKSFGLAGIPTGGVWSTAGSISMAGTLATINTIGAGSVTYTYTNANGCTSSRTMTGTGYTCAARGNVDLNNKQQTTNEFTIYPNPAKNYVSLQVETLVREGKIVVTDLNGKIVKTQPLSMGANTVNIATLSKGMYFISTITSEGKTTKKLVVE